MSQDELAARLRATFAGELQEQVAAMNEALLGLESAPDGMDHVHTLFRVAHTLKGASRAAGVPSVERLCHALEGLLTEVREGRRALGARGFQLLFSAADALADAGKRLAAEDEVDDALLGASVRDLGHEDAFAASPQPPVPASPQPPVPASPPPEPLRTRTTDAPHRAVAEGQIRIAVSKVDALLAASGDLQISARRPALRATEVEELHEALARCTARWRDQSRRLQLALDAGGAAGAEPALLALGDDLRTMAREAGRVAVGARRDARALARNLDEVAAHARTLRMRPFSEACEALPRAARDLAVSAGKEAAFQLAGAEVEADRVVLDGLREALLQLVRNAVDHGIETPDARVAAGKPRAGSIEVAADLRGDRLRVSVTDDGAGLDLAAIREALRRRNLPVSDDDEDVVRSLLEERITTRARVTTISGRGVGLDVARAAARDLGGHLAVARREGGGTVFHIDVPVSLAGTSVLLVEVASHLVAIPIGYVDRVARVAPEELRLTEGRHMLPTGTGPVPVVALARLLPPLEVRPAGGEPVCLVLLAAGGRRLAVVVDELLEAREVGVRPIRGGASSAPALRGAALLETGRIALVVDPPAVVAAGLAPDLGAGLTVEPPRATPARRRLLVVDDSITTRTLERSILEAAGYEVLTAADGAEGWRVLQERGCDLVVADVEMPGMDGFALCEAIRGSRLHATLPVVLVTAMESDQHRARGLEAGADAYIGKSSFDQEALLDTIRQLLGEHPPPPPSGGSRP